MLRFSRQTDYAIVLLAHLAEPGGGPQPAAELARESGFPEPMVRKILKALTRAGILESRRGAGGGYALAIPPERIAVRTIVEAVDGPVALSECSAEEAGLCRYERRCPVAGPVQRLNAAVRTLLGDVTLRELSHAEPAA